MPDTVNPRRSERQQVTLAVQCRTLSGMRDTGEISDITAEGCCLRTRSLFFRPGTRLIVKPQGMEGMSGVVRWVRGDQSGIEFDRALYGPIVDFIAQQNRTV